VGDRVKTRGVIVAEPQLLGKREIYIADEKGSQVYLHSAEYPTLYRGDQVELVGELSEAYGELRIKLKDKADIVKLDHPGEPTPEGLDIVDIDEGYEGSLIHVTGEVTERKANHLYLDDGTAEVKVYFKKGTGLSAKNFGVGDVMTLSGIVSERRGEYLLLPRDEADIVVTGQRSDSEVRTINTTTNTSKTPAQESLTSFFIALIAVLIGLGVKSFVDKRAQRKLAEKSPTQ